ncbi:MAG: group II intron maturase-specific domain-containing protein [Betaproteobacteria bacterium]
MAQKKLPYSLGARLVRYADDFVVLCRKGTEQAMAVIRRVLDRLGLVLNENKTRIVDAKHEGFNFLGFEPHMGRSRRTGNLYPLAQPSRKALKKIKDSVTALTKRRMTPKPLNVIIEEVNTALRGWVGYFHYRNSSKAFNRLKFHVEARVRTHLRKRHKIKSRAAGFTRFTNRSLYEKYGLYKVPTAAGWLKAHAVR